MIALLLAVLSDPSGTWIEPNTGQVLVIHPNGNGWRTYWRRKDVLYIGEMSRELTFVERRGRKEVVERPFAFAEASQLIHEFGNGLPYETQLRLRGFDQLSINGVLYRRSSQ